MICRIGVIELARWQSRALINMKCTFRGSRAFKRVEYAFERVEYAFRRTFYARSLASRFSA